MRIISGYLKGTVIHAPAGLPVRPTTDRAKESLFNILNLQFDWEELRILDLFSGTGNIAYECCSRGAKEVIAVDNHFNCVSFIKSMKERYALKPLLVHKRDVYVYLNQPQEPFDLIFADAPYAQKELIKIPNLIVQHQLLKKKGWLVMEHEVNLDLSAQSGFFDKRTYGQSAFSFFNFVAKPTET